LLRLRLRLLPLNSGFHSKGGGTYKEKRKGDRMFHDIFLAESEE
jgi:hypothetical protein